MNLGVKRLRNRGDIYSIENMTIGGHEGQANSVTNTSGLIGTGAGEMTIKADKVVNRRKGEPEARIREEAPENVFRDKNGKSAERHRECFKQSRGGNGCQGFVAHRYTVTREDAELISKSRAGRLYSGGNLKITGGVVRNKFSKMGASGDITMDVGVLDNRSFRVGVTDDLRIDKSWHEEEEADYPWEDDIDMTATTLYPRDNGRFCASGRTYCYSFGYQPLRPDSGTGRMPGGGYPFFGNSYGYRPKIEEVFAARVHDCENTRTRNRGCSYSYQIAEDRAELPDERVSVQEVFRLQFKDGSTEIASNYWENNKPTFKKQGREETLISGEIEAGDDIDITGNVIRNGEMSSGASVSFGNAMDKLSGRGSGKEGNLYRKASFLGNDFQLPGDHGLFVVNEKADHPYLVETNPLLTGLDDFMGSGYMLDKLGWTPESTTRRLGDGFYELQRLREKLQGTSQSLAGLTNEEQRQQYRELMDNGLYAAESLALSPGVELSADQINALEKDMVWPEKREVAGETVMVPVVYFAGGSDIKQEGSSIVAENISMQGGVVSNSGRIKGDKNVDLESRETDIVNQGVVEGGNSVDMASAADIRNTSGTVKGGTIRMSAEGDIVNERAAEPNRGERSRFTAVGQGGRIEGEGRVQLDAGEDIRFSGSSLSGEKVQLDAGENLRIGTTRLNSVQDIQESGHSVRTSSTRHMGSTGSSATHIVIG
jgi:adhesin HecA-like repeat protein